jgi:eukaryotic-like serine/threonine-protein kinase
MKADRWQEISTLFKSALALEPNQRAAYLQEVCGDASLRHEVESLIAAHEQAGSSMPALEVAARMVAKEPSTVSLGSSIGRYKIIGTLGTGGMGKVYLAEDTRLGRKIALKLLPEEFVKDKNRLSRFEREARAAPALSHPNVCTIHEVGETEDGHHYIAMEYIEGRSLYHRISGHSY